MKQLNLQKLQNDLRKKFLKVGVKMIGPETIFFSKDTKIGKNVIIEPYVVIGQKVKIGNNVTIKSFSHLEDVRIENNVSIGPYARLRPGSVLDKGAKVGNFVEVKKSKIGVNSKISHLSYIGDAKLGKNVNIGAGRATRTSLRARLVCTITRSSPDACSRRSNRCCQSHKLCEWRVVVVSLDMFRFPN